MNFGFFYDIIQEFYFAVLLNELLDYVCQFLGNFFNKNEICTIMQMEENRTILYTLYVNDWHNYLQIGRHSVPLQHLGLAIYKI